MAFLDENGLRTLVNSLIDNFDDRYGLKKVSGNKLTWPSSAGDSTGDSTGGSTGGSTSGVTSGTLNDFVLGGSLNGGKTGDFEINIIKTGKHNGFPTNLVGGAVTRKIDEKEITNLPGTFLKGSSYTTIKFSNLPDLTTMKMMFMGSEKLTDLNLVDLDTSKVNDMSNMVSGCRALENVNINTFNTTNVESMASMFKGDTELRSIDLTSFDLRKVTDLSNMFSGCTKLNQIDFGYGFKYGFNEGRYKAIRSGDPKGLKQAMNCNGMFNNCKSIAYIDLSWFNPINVFYDGTSQQTANIVYNSFINGLKFDPKETSYIANNSDSFYHNYIINTGMYLMFKGCESLIDFRLNIQEGSFDNNFGYTINGIKCNNEPELYKPIFTICDLSDSEKEGIRIFDKIFQFDRFTSYDKGELQYAKWTYNENTGKWDMSYDRDGKKSLFGIVVSDKIFNDIWNDQSYKDYTGYQRIGTGEITSSRIFFGGYIIISKSNFTSSQTSLASEITVDDGQDV